MPRPFALRAAFVEVGTMSPQTAGLAVCGLYVLIMACMPFLLARKTRQTTRWEPPVKRTFSWYILSLEVVVAGGLLGLVETAFVYDKDVALWLSGAAFALALVGLFGAFRFGKRLEALRLQYPAQR